MRRGEIDALVRAHRHRAQPVAFFHVLRQPSLDADDHAFLVEHIAALGPSDLIRWRARCENGARDVVIERLVSLAVEEPARFEHEVLDAPRPVFDDADWSTLAEGTRGKVPEGVWQRILLRGARPHAPVADAGPAFDLAGDLGGDLGDSFDLESLGFGDLASDAPAAAGELTWPELTVMLASEADLSPQIDRLPLTARRAILERARLTRLPGERATLLGWLAARGVMIEILFEVAVASIRAREMHPALVSFLAGQLGAASAWEKHGAGVIEAFLAGRAFAELGELMTIVFEQAGPQDARGLSEAIQAAFSRALIGAVREAIAVGVSTRALAALSALACLGAPTGGPALRELRGAIRTRTDLDDVRALVDVNLRRIERGTPEASLESIIAAVHALADAYA